ncbi:YciI family protein [Hydrogenophaga sp. 5NK40-0174]|uniref:YciI family protein n=1 Tax=Hydrogenophaga sp. 5NK40-0174 TaxID=3127649 RepID=UPI00310B3C29
MTVFAITLRFGANKAKASEHMAGHKAWITQGRADGTFLMVCSVVPGLGGFILAQGESRNAIEALVERDPFVAENVVTAEVLEIAPHQVDDRLTFLLADTAQGASA